MDDFRSSSHHLCLRDTCAKQSYSLSLWFSLDFLTRFALLAHETRGGLKPQALIQVEGFGWAVWDGRCRMSSGADDPPGAIKGSGVPHCRRHVLGRAAPGGISLPKAPWTGDKAWGHLTLTGCSRLVAAGTRSSCH